MNILIIDDEIKLACKIAEGLRIKDYDVDTVFDGREGLALLSKPGHGYDLLILDLLMPGMRGYDLCQQLRAEHIMIPIIVLTAVGEGEDKTALLSAGADEYMQKPFVFMELVARIESVLRRPRQVMSETLRVLDVELNRKERTANRDGVPLSLTQKEFGLLEYFLSNPNKVLPRAELIAHVWDDQYEPLSPLIDLSITSLRHKLDYDDHHTMLESVSGYGYRLRTVRPP
ncbi:MAG: winged helix family two component transcriptional regulator [Parcubacteria group bacterium]|nr:winged helix family two component transcriptional regulator [Parcubacteria group bacterium]